MSVVKAGLSEEIGGIVREFQTPLLRYAAAILRQADLAQDVVQETFVKYLRYRERDGEPIQNLKAWLYRVAHNQALDLLRKGRRSEELSEEMERTTPSDTFHSPDVSTEMRDAESAAMQTLAILSDRDRQIVLLKVMEEKSYKEIAEVMGVTPTNVGFILHTSLKKMARALEGRLA